MGTLGFLSRKSRGIDLDLKKRRRKGAQIELFQEIWCSSRVGTGMLGSFLSGVKGVKYGFECQKEMWDFTLNAAVGMDLIWR